MDILFLFCKPKSFPTELENNKGMQTFSFVSAVRKIEADALSPKLLGIPIEMYRVPHIFFLHNKNLYHLQAVEMIWSCLRILMHLYFLFEHIG